MNHILQFLQYNLVPEPTKQERFAFFQRISYVSEFEEFILEELGDMYKHCLPSSVTLSIYVLPLRREDFPVFPSFLKNWDMQMQII